MKYYTITIKTTSKVRTDDIRKECNSVLYIGGNTVLSVNTKDKAFELTNKLVERGASFYVNGRWKTAQQVKEEIENDNRLDKGRETGQKDSP